MIVQIIIQIIMTSAFLYVFVLLGKCQILYYKIRARILERKYEGILSESYRHYGINDFICRLPVHVIAIGIEEQNYEDIEIKKLIRNHKKVVNRFWLFFIGLFFVGGLFSYLDLLPKR